MKKAQLLFETCHRQEGEEIKTLKSIDAYWIKKSWQTKGFFFWKQFCYLHFTILLMLFKFQFGIHGIKDTYPFPSHYLLHLDWHDSRWCHIAKRHKRERITSRSLITCSTRKFLKTYLNPLHTSCMSVTGACRACCYSIDTAAIQTIESYLDPVFKTFLWHI